MVLGKQTSVKDLGLATYRPVVWGIPGKAYSFALVCQQARAHTHMHHTFGSWLLQMLLSLASKQL